ncbi:MAG: TonB-dependent receptor [Calditrichaceae bacterium]|nr:TonB-dependent receptor [Calditrichaceae bacterium]
MKFLHKKIILLLSISALLTAYLFAGTTGKLAGRVIDAASGEGLAGVNVIIEGTSMGAATDLEGNFIIIGMPPGKYTILASYISYRDMRITDLEINIDKTRRIDIELQPAALEMDGEIVVVAERPLFKKDLTSTESSIGKEAIETLPVENMQDIVNLQAGVVDGHFRGGRSGEVVYMVNGIPMNDVYSGESAIEVENNSIQELNVISGTFNAEYGQAMSGVVNVVTKEGGDNYDFSLSTYGGSYLTTNSDIFWNPDVTPLFNLQGTVGGPFPLLGKRIRLFASGRYYKDSGYIYGKNVFAPSDVNTDFNMVELPEERMIMARGQLYQFSEELAQQLIEDADYEPMNDWERYSGNIKLTYRLTDLDKLNYELMYQGSKWAEYHHEFRLNPEGDYNYNQSTMTNVVSWNHVFGASTFMDVHFTTLHTKFKQYVYEDLFDTRYVTKERLQDAGSYAFASGGQQMWHFNRSTTTWLGKADITSQVGLYHLLKAGVEYKMHELWMHEYEVIPEIGTRLAPKTSFQHNEYKHKPVEISAYFQDKLEYEDLIINAGIRFDYFDPAAGVPQDFENPGTSALEDADQTYQVSLRLGLAYPISENGAIHVSYGHFFQIPNYFYLYNNPQFNIDPLQSSVAPPPQSLKNTIGNANLKPQQSTIYEIGIQQQVSNLYGISVTAFFKDIRNLVGTEILYTFESIQYARYINRDFAYVRGITIDLEKRYSTGFAMNIDYTFQVAKGNASDPNNAFLEEQAGDQPTKQLVPLDWDRRHQINVALRVGDPNNIIFSVIGRYGSGMPYTPASRMGIQPEVENGGRKPEEIMLDLYLTKKMSFSFASASLFLKIYNLFDRLNENNVFSDTGRSNYSLEPLYTGGGRPRGLNTLEDYYIRPEFYSAPRRILIGLELGF